jgi:hypothetical protein
MRKFFSLLAILFLVGCNSTANISPTSPASGTDRPTSTKSLAAGVTRSAFTQTAPTSQAPEETLVGKTALTSQSPIESPLATHATSSSTPSPPRTLRPTLEPDEWQDQPVIPTVSQTVLEIYQHGLELGNNPRAFSKIGDCGSTPAWFLGDFDRGPQYYDLGPYQALSLVIMEFQGSYGRTSLAARSGFNASALFVPLWTDRTYCESSETPLACEYRVHRPIIAFIMLGTNDVWHPEEFEPQMRKIIEFSIDQGVIPILSTKADNQEGDGSINNIIAQLALEYDIPLWNYWAAVDPLPDHGLQEDKAHLTWGSNHFGDPEAMTKAWPMRNLTALQVLNAIWRKISGQT